MEVGGLRAIYDTLQAPLNPATKLLRFPRSAFHRVLGAQAEVTSTTVIHGFVHSPFASGVVSAVVMHLECAPKVWPSHISCKTHTRLEPYN